jgi:hypothetical protein
MSKDLPTSLALHSDPSREYTMTCYISNAPQESLAGQDETLAEGASVYQRPHELRRG